MAWRTARTLAAAAGLVAMIGLAVVGPVDAQTPGGPPVVAPPADLVVKPFIVVPGSSATVEQPAASCQAYPSMVAGAWVEGTQPVVSGDPTGIVIGPTYAPPGSVTPFDFPVPVGTEPGIYELGMFCVDSFGTFSPAPQQTGWLTVGNADGTPPSDGTMEVSSLVLNPDGEFTVQGTGFAADSEVQCWMYSDPVLLAAWSATSVGEVVGSTAMPANAALGNHTLVLAGVDGTGRPRFVTAQILLEQVALAEAIAEQVPSTPQAPAPSAPVTAMATQQLPLTG